MFQIMFMSNATFLSVITYLISDKTGYLCKIINWHSHLLAIYKKKTRCMHEMTGKTEIVDDEGKEEKEEKRKEYEREK